MNLVSKKFTIFGNPVEHSISPKMHTFAIKGLGLDATYNKFKLENGERLKEEFFTQNLNGANVTVPHKETAFKSCDEVRGIAKEIGAVNTLVLEDGKMIGYNTDAIGFYMSASEFKDIKKILIIGAGGTAKAISLIYKQKNLDVSILNRSKNRVKIFKENGFNAYCWDEFSAGKYDLVVNTTSAGLVDNEYPLPKNMLIDILNNSKYAIDVIYNKNTPFLALAKELNIPCKDGSDMLLYQGVKALNLFYKDRLYEESVTKFMKKAF